MFFKVVSLSILLSLAHSQDEDVITKLQNAVLVLQHRVSVTEAQLEKTQTRLTQADVKRQQAEMNAATLKTQLTSQLNTAVKRLQETGVALSKEGARIAMAEKEIQRLKDNSGTTFVHWGRTSCPGTPSTTLVYSGAVGGTGYDTQGGAADYVCLPPNPQWNKYGQGGTSSGMYGTEYQDLDNLFGTKNAAKFLDNDVVCAVCHVASRSSQIMIPARRECQPGWTKEYEGYLMTSYESHAGKKLFTCVDENPEVARGSVEDKNGALMYRVIAQCGSLQCPNYVQGRELTCVVCTK